MGVMGKSFDFPLEFVVFRLQQAQFFRQLGTHVPHPEEMRQAHLTENEKEEEIRDQTQECPEQDRLSPLLLPLYFCRGPVHKKPPL
jgi:hypothetical protein